MSIRVSLLVTGSRDGGDSLRFVRTIAAFEEDHGFVVVRVIQGGASGWDAEARTWASATGVACETFDADWERLGRRAGPVRNQKMLDDGRPDHVLAFAGGAGTADMVARALRFGVPVWRPFLRGGRVVVRRLSGSP